MSNITGTRKVIKNLGRVIDLMIDGAVEGLIEGGRKVREDGMRITPVDSSNLIGSWYGPIVAERGLSQILIEIGLTAMYAPYVHEMVEASFKKPGASAKFLENPLLRNATYTKHQMRLAIKRKARI